MSGKLSFGVYLFNLFLFSLLVIFTHAQSVMPVRGISYLISSIDTFSSRLPVEKLFLHLDKPNYNAGDTIWFKTYLFDNSSFAASEKSGIYYVEIANDSNKVVKRMKLPVNYGLGWGNIALDTKQFSEGNYILRAYTNWMRNFKEDYIFSKAFSISDPKQESWLVNTDTHLLLSDGKSHVKTVLQFYHPNKQPLITQEMNLRVMEGKKTIYQNKMQTSRDGSLNVNFDLPEKADTRNISIIAEALTKEAKTKVAILGKALAIPLDINHSENIDLQFMPEGGYLVSGITSKVGFKALGEDGLGITAEGKIINNKSQEVAAFKSTYKGMGSFELTPKTGETYTAQLILSNGEKKNYPLPEVKASGTVLVVKNDLISDSLEVNILSFAIPDAGGYYLVGQSGGRIYYVSSISLQRGIIKKSILKVVLPTGIARFTLLDQHYQPLNERLVYIDNPANKLNISIETNNPFYNLRDSIALHIRVTDDEGKPVQGSFSLSVTDKSQVKQDSATYGSIYNHLFITSGLKGNIETPNYYTSSTPEAYKALDNLLLTQGWAGYDWKGIFNPPVPEYSAEPEFVITGKASSTFGGIRNAKVNLFSQKPFVLKEAVADEQGRFIFRDLPISDSATYKIQSYNRNGKSFMVDVKVDEWKPPVFALAKRTIPWYVNTDSIRLENITSSISRKEKEEKALIGDGKLLQEVVIKAKKNIPGSFNLNGEGEADQILDEKDMLKEGKMNLLELLYKRVDGFKTGSGQVVKAIQGAPPIPEVTFKIKDQKVKFIIDGVDADQTYEYYQPLDGGDVGEGITQRLEFIKDILSNFTAEDILGIEVMYKVNHNSKYNTAFLSTTELNNRSFTKKGAFDYAYLEITTRGGHGPFINKTPGIYFYKPLPFSFPQKFYRPRYAVKENGNETPDLRSTIHWEPNIITDTAGMAIVSFYAADKPATYTIVVEGSDMNGKVGSVIKETAMKVCVNCAGSGTEAVSAGSLPQTFEAHRKRFPIEKLYLHLDKPGYITGDTLWFKAYLLDGARLDASQKSGIFYIELADDDKVIKRARVPLYHGLGSGNIALNEKDFPGGNYTVRGYTNLMRNFGEDYVFARTFSVIPPSPQNWLVNTDTRLSNSDGKENVQIALKLSNLNGEALGLQKVELNVMVGKRTLYQRKLQTSKNGLTELNFPLPEKTDAKNISLTVTSQRAGEADKKLNIPVSINRPTKTDLQFMPEGGYLVAGLMSKIGFKSVGEDGRGVAVEGKILDSKQQEAVAFKSIHKGMGAFELNPKAGEIYTAQIILPNGLKKSYPLPAVKISGTVMNVKNPVNSDSIEVSLSAAAIADTESYYLIGQTRGIIYYAKNLKVNNGTVKSWVPKRLFPGGIARFTLLNKNYQPLNERIIYIDEYQGKLNIVITSDTSSYQSRDSIALNILVKDIEGRPVQGSFSLAVTDDSQVKSGSTEYGNILTYLLLASDLKGTIEEPGYYTHSTQEARAALDNLFITQGWVGYDWKDVFNPKVPQYEAEPEFIIKGKSTNSFNGVANTKVLLYSSDPFLLKDTLTGSDGRFIFRNLPVTEKAAFIIQSWRRNGGRFFMDVKIDEFQPPVFNSHNSGAIPWYVNSDSTLLKHVQSAIALENAKSGHQAIVLKEVLVTAKDITQVTLFDEKALMEKGTMSLWDYLTKNIKGFYYGYGFKPNNGAGKSEIIQGFWINDKSLSFFADGNGISSEWGEIYTWFNYFPVQDFKNIKVTVSKDRANINITSRAGKGLLQKETGTALYRPVPQFLLPKQFYRPKYEIKDHYNEIQDFRSTLHWEPNVITDAEGNARVSFYSADKPSTYTVAIEGSDMRGRIGSMTKEAFIKILP